MSIRKVTLNLPEEQIIFLQKIAKEQDLSFTDIVRRAINTEIFFIEQAKKGHKILVEDGKGRLREVIRV